jgi:patatin-like phospholipase/acyl hydrolase
LACGHAFCLDCIQELTELANDHYLPHRCTVIKCPIHRELEPQKFSPRLLPIQSGYRILSLDGGGVKGIALLTMLAAVEKKCFGIPVIHLFDLVVGTSIGGQIALALNTPAPFEPLTVTAATIKFRELMKTSFVSKSYLPFNFASVLADKTKYKAKPVERQLKAIFTEETKLFSMTSKSSQSNVPNIAVTTVAVTNVAKPYLIAN